MKRGSVVTAFLFLALASSVRAELVGLSGATLHTGAGRTIENSGLVMDGGKIVWIGPRQELPRLARIVDVRGKHIYPSFIVAEAPLGLTEIGSVRGTRDTTEVGRLNPHIRTEVAINPDSELLPVAMSNGILLAGVAPAGGLVSGTSAVVALEGWTWEDMTVHAPAGLYVNWPNMRIRRGPDVKPPAKKQERKREESLREIREVFRRARAWHRAKASSLSKGTENPDSDARWEAMGPVLRGEIPVFVRARRYGQIRAALDWAEEENLDLVLTGANDAWRFAEELAERGVGVILDPVHGTPTRDYEPYDTTYTAAASLVSAGVDLCISTSWASNVRNLPYQAATAHAYGLSEEDTLAAITANCARILGVGDRYGSLEVGKSATLIVTDGSPLEITTQVERAWLDGEELPLRDRHKRFYDKYRNRPRPSVLPETRLDPAPGR